LLAAGCLVVSACSRFDAPQTTAWRVEGGLAVDGSARVQSFGGAFSEIVASDKRSRSVLLVRNLTDSEPQEFMLIDVDDGRILDRVSTPPFVGQAPRAQEWLDQGSAQPFLEHLAAMARKVSTRRVRLEPAARAAWSVDYEETGKVVMRIDSKRVDSEAECYVQSGDGRAFAPAACGDGNRKPLFYKTEKRTSTWEPDATYDVCFFMRSSGGRSKKVDCMKAVIGATSRCDGGVCTLFANSNPGPVVFTLIEDGTGEVFGSGSLQARSLDDVATQNGRVALRFGVSRAVIDLRAKKVFERIPAPDETGAVHEGPLVWFGDDDLLSCEIDQHADKRRSCKRLDILPLADASKWRTAPESIRFEFAAKR